jgi:hypothetical protein
MGGINKLATDTFFDLWNDINTFKNALQKQLSQKRTSCISIQMQLQLQVKLLQRLLNDLRVPCVDLAINVHTYTKQKIATYRDER